MRHEITFVVEIIGLLISVGTMFELTTVIKVDLHLIW